MTCAGRSPSSVVVGSVSGGSKALQTQYAGPAAAHLDVVSLIFQGPVQALTLASARPTAITVVAAISRLSG